MYMESIGSDVAVEVVLPAAVEPEGMLLRAQQLRAAGEGHVVLTMEATGISFAEQQMRRGKYYDQPPFPFVPGYDLVGVVSEVGAGVATELIGRRFAAVTKTGAWADRVEVAAADLLEVPDGLDPVSVEAAVVNGITAWRMLHEVARVRPGGRILVLGANGGVGSTLVQLAVRSGIEVIGTAAVRHHGLLRELGAAPLAALEGAALADAVRAHAPGGLDAVFDHVGGRGVRTSWSLLRRGGALVSYGTASTKNVAGSSQLPVLKLFGALAIWNALPNGRRASFFNFWAGKKRDPRGFRARQASAFTAVCAALARGELRPLIAATMPLDQASAALTLAESRTVAGKVILTPSTPRT
ncbi:medium chain dehydrogenase/reductase family protein [Arenivirga flava]|nr:medium chain dehydrogenase/reductase family protein [Arenivirga flava]